MNRPKRTRRRRLGRLARPAGLVALVFVIVPSAMAVFVAYRYHLGVPQTVISALIGGGTLASVYQGWANARGDGAGVKDVKLRQIADDLAEIMQQQWTSELGVRQRHDQGVPLSVSWEGAKPPLACDWAELVLMAGEAGWPAAPPPGTWAAGPGGLDDVGSVLTDVFTRVPTSRLVVLGEAGAGKTMLMVRLLLDLLGKRRAGERVPVLVTIGSWNPRTQSLREFIAERLILDHPPLAAPTVVAGREISQIRALLSRGMILPILDGFDEIRPEFRKDGINRINDLLSAPGPLPLLLTSRVEQYAKAIGRPGDDWEPLHGAAAIVIRPLGVEQVKKYLAHHAPESRWERVLADLGTPNTAVAEALRTPLFVTLARAIYNPRRGERLGQVPDPTELCDKYSQAEQIKDHLFDAFIPAVYRPTRRVEDADEYVAERWSAAEAEKWLAYLARLLNQQPGDEQSDDEQSDDEQSDDEQTKDLQWWALRDAAPPALIPTAVGVVCGIAAGLAAALGSHVGVGIGVGFGTGMLVAIAIGQSVRYATHFADTHPGPGMTGALAGATIGGIAAGFAHKLGIGSEASLFSGLPEALGIGIGAGASTSRLGGFIGGLVGGFFGGLLEGMGLGPPAGLVNGLGVGLAAGLAVAYCGRREPARQWPQWLPEIGIPGGLVIGLAIGLITWREKGLIYGFALGPVVGGFAAWPIGLRDTPQPLNEVPSPRNALARDAHAFTLTALAAGIAAALAGFVGGSLSSIFEIGAQASISRIVGDGLGIGLSSGVVIGLAFGFYHAASPSFMLSSWWLALTRKLPWRLMAFLDEVHQKSILRQFGAVYQFRHEKFRVHLARTDAADAQPPTGGGPGADEPSAESWPVKLGARARRAKIE